MKKLLVIKIGGNIIDDENKLSSFLSEFAAVAGMKVLVHGGGKQLTELAKKLGVVQTVIEGRRVTDDDTLDLAKMTHKGMPVDFQENARAALRTR